MHLIFILLTILACHGTATGQAAAKPGYQSTTPQFSNHDILQKTGSGTPGEVFADSLLRQVMIDNQLFAEYTYDTNGRILEEKTKYLYTKYFRNEKGQVTMSLTCEDPSLVSSNSRILDAGKKRKEWVSPDNTENCRQQNYEYNEAGQLVRMTTFRGYSTFVYDSHNRIIRQDYHFLDNFTSYVEYHYDKKGNVARMVRFEIDGAGKARKMTTHEYEFDQHINPYRAFGLSIFPGKYTNHNNITCERYILHLMSKQESITKYEYEYDLPGYPVTVNKNQRFIYHTAGR